MRPFVTIGKRKRAVAKASVKEGTGKIRINKIPLDVYQPELLKMKIMEPIVLAGEDKIKKVDIDVVVKGGGISGQAEAVRQAIARAIVKVTKSESIKKKFMEYDRSMLVFDPRRTEPHKQSRSRKGPRATRQTSYR